MNNRNFTLLEVITAMTILTIGVTAFLWQQTMAQKLTSDNYTQWQQTHELIQAAEYVLLHGGSLSVVDQDFLTDDYQVFIEYKDIEEDYIRDITIGNLKLQTALLTIFDQNMIKIDQLSLVVWKE